MFKIFNLLPLPLPLVLISNQGAKVERAPFSFHVCNLFLSCNNGCSLSFLQLPDSTTHLPSFSQGSFSPPHSAPSPGWFLLLLGEVLQTFLLRAPSISLRLQCLGFSFNINLFLNQLSALFFQFVLLHPYKGFLEQERASRSVHFSHLQCAANSNATLEVEEALLKL